MNLNASSSGLPSDPLFVKLKESSNLNMKNIKEQAFANTVKDVKQQAKSKKDLLLKSGRDLRTTETLSGITPTVSSTSSAMPFKENSENLSEKTLLTCPLCKEPDRVASYFCFNCQHFVCYYCSVIDENNVESCNQCINHLALDSPTFIFPTKSYGITDMYSDPIDSTPPSSPPRCPAILKRTRTQLSLKKVEPATKLVKAQSDQDVSKTKKDIWRDLRRYIQDQCHANTFCERELLRKECLQHFMNHDCYLDQTTFNMKLDYFLDNYYENLYEDNFKCLKEWIQTYKRYYPDRDQALCIFDFYESNLKYIEEQNHSFIILIKHLHFRSYFGQWMDYFHIPKQKSTKFFTIIPSREGFVLQL